jgi:hypothetical protein
MNLTDCNIIDSKLIKEIAKNYNTLDYTPKLRGLLNLIYPQSKLNRFCKLDLHRKINDLLLNGYEGEQVIKYRLFKAFQNSNLVAAYEIKVKNSRVDFLTINGHTTSYEIKSNLDNLDKLAKQSDDYLRAFEFNNIVIHERHLNRCINIIPKSFGVITVDREKHTVVRKPMLNKCLDAETQLDLLTKKELNKYYESTNKSIILDKLPGAQINELFKLALKGRYKTRWSFIVENSNEILPIDIQFFFNKNIKPAYIYT